MPTEEEIATIRYLSVYRDNDQWHIGYSFDDPFTNEQTKISNYVITDKLLNTQRIESMPKRACASTPSALVV